MRWFLLLLFLILLQGCAHLPASSDLSIRDIEKMPFMNAYHAWRQEKESLMSKGTNGICCIPTGVTDAKTGIFTPSTIAALQCRLGQEADLHEAFLRQELAADADVYVLLESSRRLCEKYGVHAVPQVTFVPGQGYVHNTTDGCIPQAQQARWLKAMERNAREPNADVVFPRFNEPVSTAR